MSAFTTKGHQHTAAATEGQDTADVFNLVNIMAADSIVRNGFVRKAIHRVSTQHATDKTLNGFNAIVQRRLQLKKGRRENERNLERGERLLGGERGSDRV